MLSSAGLYGQCVQFSADLISSTCVNDAGTPNDPSDDTYESTFFIDNGLNPNGTWSASGDYIGGSTYSPFIFTIGPFNVSDGPRSVTFTDDQFGCTETVIIEPEPCEEPPGCGDFNLCVALDSKAGCTATYTLTINADFNGATVSLIGRAFSVSGGKVVLTKWSNPLNPLSLGGVSLFGDETDSPSSFGFSQLGASFVAPSGANSYIIEIDIEANPGECINIIPDSPLGAYFNSSAGIRCPYTMDDCPIEEWCPETATISGTIEKGIGSCEGTEDNGISGAEVSITGPGGTTACDAVTDDTGFYSCETCQEGPFDVCATTTCPEPCGLTTLDIVLMQRHILRLENTYDGTIPYSGDLNGSGTVSGADVVELRKYLLGLETAIDNWCRFIPTGDYNEGLVNGTNSVDNCITIDNASSLVDFVQFNLGDVNGSCSDCDHGDDDGDGGQGDDGLVGEGIDLDIERAGTTILVKASQALADLHHLSIKLPLENGESVQGISGLTSNLDYKVCEGNVYVIWSDTTLMDHTIVDGTILFSITLAEDATDQTEAPRGFKELISLRSGIHPISKQLEERADDAEPAVGYRSVLINSRYELEIGSSATISALAVYSLQGQQVAQQQVSVSTDNLYIPQLDRLRSGIYLVSLLTSDGIVTKKMYIQQY